MKYDCWRSLVQTGMPLGHDVVCRSKAPLIPAFHASVCRCRCERASTHGPRFTYQHVTDPDHAIVSVAHSSPSAERSSLHSLLLSSTRSTRFARFARLQQKADRLASTPRVERQPASFVSALRVQRRGALRFASSTEEGETERYKSERGSDATIVAYASAGVASVVLLRALRRERGRTVFFFPPVSSSSLSSPLSLLLELLSELDEPPRHGTACHGMSGTGAGSIPSLAPCPPPRGSWSGSAFVGIGLGKDRAMHALLTGRRCFPHRTQIVVRQTAARYGRKHALPSASARQLVVSVCVTERTSRAARRIADNSCAALTGEERQVRRS